MNMIHNCQEKNEGASLIFIHFPGKEGQMFKINTEFIKKKIKEKGETQLSFGLLVGIDQGQLSKLLDGKLNWQVWHIVNIAKELDMHPGELFLSKSGKNNIEISHITPQDEWNYEKRKAWAKEIVPKYPNFNPTTDNFFKIYLEGTPAEIGAMETMINSLAGQQAGHPKDVEEKRERPPNEDKIVK